VAIDVDPPAEGELFADTEAHVRSQARAAGEVRCLVEKEVEDIALETSVPRAPDVIQMLSAAIKRGYKIKEVAPAGDMPEDLFYCIEHSTHHPPPDFLADVAAKWELLGLDRDPQREDARAERCRKAWALFIAARSAGTQQEAEDIWRDLEDNYAAEIGSMQLDAVPKLGRTKFEGTPAFPLAEICPYWASVKAELTHVEPPAIYQKLPDPKVRVQKRCMERAFCSSL
jgi:hypothetical protein